MGGGEGLLTTAAVVPAWTWLGLTFPTPKEKEPAVVWPSSSDTVRQVTVYTPSLVEPSPIWSSRGWPGTGCTEPWAWLRPVVSSAWITESFGSGHSEKVITSLDGACLTTDP